jgi:hypothetical protein
MGNLNLFDKTWFVQQIVQCNQSTKIKITSHLQILTLHFTAEPVIYDQLPFLTLFCGTKIKFKKINLNFKMICI